MHLDEKVGDAFDLRVLSEAQEKCKALVEKIAHSLKPGISEAEGQVIIKEVFTQAGIEKLWHPSKFRFGSETTKTFRDFPNVDLRFKSDDIFFLDVGPVIQGHEADFGRTFYFGSSAAMQALQGAAQEVWNVTADHWKRQNCSGAALYSFAQKKAEQMGYILDNRMNGHRIGDFPHALYSKKKLEDLDQCPSPQRWVLEIHLVSKDLERGAFFEDIL